jgi:hypothetical protein
MRMSLIKSACGGPSSSQRGAHLAGAGEAAHGQALAGQGLLQHEANRVVVVYNPDHDGRVRNKWRVGRFYGSGMVKMQKSVRPGWLSQSIDSLMGLHDGLRQVQTEPGAALASRSRAERTGDPGSHCGTPGPLSSTCNSSARRQRCLPTVTWRATRVRSTDAGVAPPADARLQRLGGVLRHVEHRLDELLAVATELGQRDVVVALDRRARAGTRRAPARARARRPRGC